MLGIMAYRSLYLTYRPQTFEQVAGQKTIVRTLQNALRTGKIAHSYLFAGPRGTGKTSMARLFAKALNCEEGVGHQCGHCSNCEAIVEGTHPDVIEIDAASNNGVEQVRDLIDRVKYAPIKGRTKIYIIDDHTLPTHRRASCPYKTRRKSTASRRVRTSRTRTRRNRYRRGSTARYTRSITLRRSKSKGE